MDYGINLPAMLRLHFLAVPASVLSALAAGKASPAALAAAAAVGLLTAWGLLRTRSMPGTPLSALRLVLAGMVAFFTGYAIFLLTQAVTFTIGGIGNRTAFAAAIGVVLVFVGLLRGLSLAFRGYGNTAFALAFAAVAALSTLRSAEIGGYWAQADDIRRERFANAEADLADLPADAVVLIDGLCPYLGPAIVLETDWGTMGFLDLLLGRPVTADTTARMVFGEDAAVSSIYITMKQSYRYGPNLFLYNVWNRRLESLTDAATTRAAVARPDRFPEPCPPGHPGHGAPF